NSSKPFRSRTMSILHKRKFDWQMKEYIITVLCIGLGHLFKTSKQKLKILILAIILQFLPQHGPIILIGISTGDEPGAAIEPFLKWTAVADESSGQSSFGMQATFKAFHPQTKQLCIRTIF